jgi:hypothetical protein
VVDLMGHPGEWWHGVRIGHDDDSTPAAEAGFSEDGLGLPHHSFTTGSGG